MITRPGTSRHRGTVRRRGAGVVVGVVAAAVLVGAVLVAEGSGRSTRTPRTDAEVAAMAPAAQARLLQPLRRIAGLLDARGRSDKDVYSGVDIVATRDEVDLFVTHRSAGVALRDEARHASPHAAWRTVRVRTSTFSRFVLEKAAGRLLDSPSAGAVEDVSVPADGRALQVQLRAPVADSSRLTAGLEVPVSITVDPAIDVKSWSYDKWHDSAPFIGGDVLTSQGKGGICTAGLPAVRTSDGRPVIVTASHCFATGTRVYTGAGTPGAVANGRIGNYVGTVTTRNLQWDAEEIVGADNNADESDTSGWKPLTSVAYSYTGDYVCQNGAASFYLGHPTPCGIKVTDDDVWFSIAGHLSRGVEGIDVRTGWGAHNGDSGGTVFSIGPRGTRQARGIVSSGGRDGTVDQRRVDWTEAVDIFRSLHLRLNPRT